MNKAILRAFVGSSAAVLMFAGIAAAPAQAASYPTYKSKSTGECLQGRSSDAAVLSAKCDGGSDQDWEVESRPQKGTSNQVVKLRNIKYNRCLDSNGGASGKAAYTNGCNTGNYQLWEVFVQSNGTRVFKSWGAWKNQGRHLCLAEVKGKNPVLKTCTSKTIQQWTKVS